MRSNVRFQRPVLEDFKNKYSWILWLATLIICLPFAVVAAWVGVTESRAIDTGFGVVIGLIGAYVLIGFVFGTEEDKREYESEN